MRVTKNWKDFYDIDESNESVEGAFSKGYTPVITVTKDGSETYDLDANDTGSVRAAFDKGYYEVNALKNLEESSQEARRPSKAKVALRGGVQGASFGFVDELAGGTEAIRSLGGDEDFKDAYKRGRDEWRAEDKIAEAENPWLYKGSEFVGGALVPLGAGATAKTLGGAFLKGAGAGALQGTIAGIGTSEDETALGMAEDAALGGALGGVLGGPLGVTGSALGRSLTKGGRESLEAEARALHRGFSKPVEGAGYLEPLKRVKGAFNEAGATQEFLTEFKNLIGKSKNNLVSRMVEDGEPKERIEAARSMLRKMGDDDYVKRMLLEDGPNEVKDWVTKNASATGGRFQPEHYASVLNDAASQRAEARRFNARERGSGLLDYAKKAEDSFMPANMTKVRELTEKGAPEFGGDSEAVDRALWAIQSSYEDSQSLSSIPSGVGTRIRDVLKIIEKGKGPSHMKLREGDYTGNIRSSDRFFRFQKAREHLDEGIDWEKITKDVRPMTSGEKILAGLRDEFDTLLKEVPGKREADEVWQTAARIEKSVFDKSSYGGGIDKYKLAQLLSNADQSQRFSDDLNQLKAWAEDPKFDSSAREFAKNFVDEFTKAVDVAQRKRKIDAFDYKQGPSSAAIERLGNQIKDRGTIQTFIESPATAVQGMDNFLDKYVPMAAGRPFKELSDKEKSAVVDLWTWFNKSAKDGRGITDEAVTNNYQKFLKDRGGGGGGPGSGGPDGGGGGLNFSGAGMPPAIEKAFRGYIQSKGEGFVADQMSRAMGMENGIDVFEPYKEDFREYLKNNHGFSETEAKIATGLLPSNPLEIPGLMGGRPAKKSEWIDSGVSRHSRNTEIYKPREKPILERPIRIGGENYTHAVWRDGHEFTHQILDKNGKPLAVIEGHNAIYEDPDIDNIHGFAINWAKSKKPGLGKRIYELVLDSHGDVISDYRLSKGGSVNMYETHYPNIKGVSVTDALEDTMERFVVSGNGDNKYLRTPSKARRWSAEEKAIIDREHTQERDLYSSDEDLPYDYRRQRDEDEDDEYYDDEYSASERKREKKEEKKRQERSSLTSAISDLRRRRLEADIRGEDPNSEYFKREIEAIKSHPLFDSLGLGWKQDAERIFDKRNFALIGENQGRIDRIRSMLNSPREQYRTYAEGVVRELDDIDIIEAFDPKRAARLREEENRKILKDQLSESKSNYRRSTMDDRILKSWGEPLSDEAREAYRRNNARRRERVIRDAKEYGLELPPNWEATDLTDRVGDLSYGAPSLEQARKLYMALTGRDRNLKREAQAILDSISPVRREQLESIMRTWSRDGESVD